MKSFRFVASTPDGNVFSQDVLEISLRGSEGALGVRADHIPFITSVIGGEMRITDEDGEDDEGDEFVELDGALDVTDDVLESMGVNPKDAKGRDEGK